LLYHAGMIARAAADMSAARDFLDRALALSPQFDPLQAALARKIAATESEPMGASGPGIPDATPSSIAAARP
jgi:hypothetical protein